MNKRELRDWVASRAAESRRDEFEAEEARLEAEAGQRMSEALDAVDGAPTDEQLANLAVTMGFPIMATPMFMKMDNWREGMLNLHAMVQDVVNGDPDAAMRLGWLREQFGHTS